MSMRELQGRVVQFGFVDAWDDSKSDKELWVLLEDGTLWCGERSGTGETIDLEPAHLRQRLLDD